MQMILDIDLEKFLLFTFQSKNNETELDKKKRFQANIICMLLSKLCVQEIKLYFDKIELTLIDKI